jgi:hypothetical protein
VIFYVHPREIDPDHPRLPMGASRRFKTYVNLRTTERKIRNILADFPVTTFNDYMNQNRPPGGFVMEGGRTAEFFDAYARDFSAIYGNENTLVNSVVNKLFRKSMMLRYERTLAGCAPIAGKTVIDIGCGRGTTAWSWRGAVPRACWASTSRPG